ncbi:MAG: hypothetical protein AAGH73_09295 [Pseudomonadota bacterium]
MFGPVVVTVLVVFILAMFFPTMEITVSGFTVQASYLFVLFMGGLCGGARFVYLRARPMEIGEKVYAVVLSYLLVTLIPLAIFGLFVYIARDEPSVARLFEIDTTAGDWIGFLVGYVGVDIVPNLVTLYIAMSLPKLVSPARHYS